MREFRHFVFKVKEYCAGMSKIRQSGYSVTLKNNEVIFDLMFGRTFLMLRFFSSKEKK